MGDRAAVFGIDAFVKALREAHRLAWIKAQSRARRLLQRRGHKRRRGLGFALFGFDIADAKFIVGGLNLTRLI